MSDFQTLVTAADAAPDPSKHVNYVQGMVLGVDDFNQEFAFLNGRIQWLAREAIGYGALSGLHVSVEPTGDGPRVRVAAGVALTPRGELVCVPEDQCALINPWLVENNASLPAGLNQTLYVRLCYKFCATDNLPIPGEPCRDEDELMAPSRIADDFRLELATTPPDQREEDMVRAFAAWLRNVRLTNDPDVATSAPDFVDAVREAWADGGELSAMPPETLFIPTDSQSDYLRLALRIWATELRPHARAAGGICANPPDEGCIGLAALDVRLTLDRLESLDEPDVREERAPFLLHLRMLQEWLIAGRHDALPSDTVREETAYGLAPDAGLAEEYSRADHTHGTPPLPELLGDVDSFPAPPDSIPSLPDAPDHRIWTTVVAIQGTPIAPEPPTQAGQPLVFDGGAWHPGPVPITLAPGETVVPERTYLQGEAVGESLLYARADHTHGTPPPPTLDGEVVVTSATDTGAVFQLNTRVAQIYAENVGLRDGAPDPTAGQVLKLIDVGGALEWRPADDNAGAGGPTPGTVVIPERTYGQATNLGTSLNYARADHTHGTPPAPTFTGEIGIVATQSTETEQEYTMRVAAILQLPVAENPAPTPSAGDVLTLVGSPDKLEWQIGSGGTGGSFVVAAGSFSVPFTPANPPAPTGTLVGTPNAQFGALQAFTQDQMIWVLNFPAYDPESDYVVIGTPWIDISPSGPHLFEFVGHLTAQIAVTDWLKDMINRGFNGLVVRVTQLVFGDNAIRVSPPTIGFTIQISLYPRQDG